METTADVAMLKDAGYQTPGLRTLNVDEINWDPNTSTPCKRCQPGGLPTAGSYASTLLHYERVLGPMSERRERTRLLLLFQDPRFNESHFNPVNPLVDPAKLASGSHRYFCLTPAAWTNLGLHKEIGPAPSWPTRNNAHLFVRRYFGRGPRAWSYDGMVAYFLWLFGAGDAYVTNAAKCHFDKPHEEVYDMCVQTHLSRELQMFAPNIILSFTSALSDERVAAAAIPATTALLRIYHPAARGRVSADDKRDSFVDEIESNSRQLELLGYDLSALKKRWLRDVEVALDPATQSG